MSLTLVGLRRSTSGTLVNGWCRGRVAHLSTTRLVLRDRRQPRLWPLEVAGVIVFLVCVGPFVLSKVAYREEDLSEEIDKALSQIEAADPQWRRVKEGGNVPLSEVFDYSGEYPSRAATVFQHGDRIWKLNSAVVGSGFGSQFEKTMVWTALPLDSTSREIQEHRWYSSVTEKIVMVDASDTGLSKDHQGSWQVEQSFNFLTQLPDEPEGTLHPLVHTVTTHTHEDKAKRLAETHVQMTTVDYAKPYSRTVTYSFSFPGPESLPLNVLNEVRNKWRDLFSKWASQSQNTQP